MAIRHRELPAEGVQFHPESVLTRTGKALLANFLCPLMPTTSSPPAIDALASGNDLAAEEAAAVLPRSWPATPPRSRSPAFLIGLRTKGETVDELAGLAARCARSPRRCRASRRLVDTAGTGGGRPTFNVSTTAALIAAGAGCALAKHGNRSATGLSGCADVLEALGARIDLGPGGRRAASTRPASASCSRPAHHAATRYVVPVRKELAVRTIFNFLGPLTNPAGARAPADRRLRPGLPGARWPGPWRVWGSTVRW